MLSGPSLDGSRVRLDDPGQKLKAWPAVETDAMPSPRLALLLAAALVPLQANGAPRMVKGVPAALLAEAAKATPLRSIDYDEDHCDNRTVDQWLRALTGPNARSIIWQGGPCQIVGMVRARLMSPAAVTAPAPM